MQPNPVSLSCSNKTSKRHIRSQNQSRAHLTCLSPTISSSQAAEGKRTPVYDRLQHLNVPRWLSRRRVYVFIYVNIMLICFSTCRSRPIAPFKFDVRWLMQPWWEVTAPVARSLSGVEWAQMYWIFVIGSKERSGFEKSRRCPWEPPFKKTWPKITHPFVRATFSFSRWRVSE